MPAPTELDHNLTVFLPPNPKERPYMFIEDVDQFVTGQYAVRTGRKPITRKTTPSNRNFAALRNGFWVIQKTAGQHGHEVAFLRSFDADWLEYKTPSEDPTFEQDVERYAQWMREGKAPPPIKCHQGPDGHFLVTEGRRRAEAAKRVGVKIRAWFTPPSPLSKTEPMTYEAAHGESIFWRKVGTAPLPPQNVNAGNWESRFGQKDIKSPEHLDSLLDAWLGSEYDSLMHQLATSVSLRNLQNRADEIFVQSGCKHYMPEVRFTFMQHLSQILLQYLQNCLDQKMATGLVNGGWDEEKVRTQRELVSAWITEGTFKRNGKISPARRVPYNPDTHVECIKPGDFKLWKEFNPTDAPKQLEQVPLFSNLLAEPNKTERTSEQIDAEIDRLEKELCKPARKNTPRKESKETPMSFGL